MLYKFKLALLLFFFSGCAVDKQHLRADGRRAGIADYQTLRAGKRLPPWVQGYIMGIIQSSDEDTVIITNVIEKEKR